MKMTPVLNKAWENMEPGKISAAGFLGEDDRPLPDILTEDEERMRRLGLHYEYCAMLLRNLLQRGEEGLGEPITLDDTWLVSVSEARGHLPCPFEDGIQRKIVAEIVNRKNGKTLRVSSLSLHLMEKHHFLQGRGAPFRLEPEQIKAVLGL